MSLTKKEKEKLRVERQITSWCSMFMDGCDKIYRLAKAIEALNATLDKGTRHIVFERRLDYNGVKRKDITKKI